MAFVGLFFFGQGGITGAAVSSLSLSSSPESTLAGSFEQSYITPQNFITTSQADGLIAYGELNVAIPRFRTWNSSNNFSTEQSAPSIGIDGTNDITWAVVRGNHERDEIILGTEDKGNDVNIQVYPANKTWGAVLEVSADVLNSNSRAFDIAVEDISGDALIVYEDSSAADTSIRYQIWNGSQYSDQNTLVTGLASSPIRWVRLVQRPGTDDMMLLIHDNAADLHAHYWNGTGFDLTRNTTLSTGTTSSLTQHFAFAWESMSGDGLAVYGTGTNLVYRTFSITAPHWSTETTIALGNALGDTRLCSDPTSDYVGLIIEDGGSDVNARMWNGTEILASPPTEDLDAEPAGANNVNVDCAWYNSSTALFGFVDLSSLSVDYVQFTKANTWSVADLNTAPTTSSFASDDIDGLRFTPHPTTTEIMVTAMDILEDISVIRWDGVGFSAIGESPIETSTEVLTAAQEAVMFDWYRYDPVPNVTALNPNGLNFNPNAILDINATVTDNILVGTVLANVTLPNGTIQQLTLTNRSGNTILYNATFAVTSLSGTYSVRIIANDTSIHQNTNSTQVVTFTIGDAFPPAVTNLTPVAGSSFVQNATLNISATVADTVGVSQVFANITFPNGSIERRQLLNSSFALYNSTFSTTSALGTYLIRFIANDTSNMINSSEATSFSIIDVTAPLVTNITPVAGTNFIQNALVNITANVTNTVAISVVLVNITFPNGSITQLQLSNRSLALYNGTFNVTRDVGTYTARIIANDTSNNLNASESTTFIVSSVVVNDPVTLEQLSCSQGAEVNETVYCSFTTRYANGTSANNYGFNYNVTNSSEGPAFAGIANNTRRFGRYIFSFVPTVTDTYGVMVSNESLGFANSVQVGVFPRRGLTNEQERNLNQSLANLNQTAATINQTIATILGNINNQTQVVLSDFGEVAAGSSYRTRVWTFDFQGNPKAPDATPVITLYDPLRNIIAQSVAMDFISQGVFAYNFTTTTGHTAGVWETQVNVTSNARNIQLSDYWELESSPAQVVINSISDATVPTITADITITNEGSAAFEYQYEYCIVAEQSNQCGGGDDLGYASAAKLIAAGADFNTQLTLSGITQAGTLYFKLVVYFGTEKSGATRSFTATASVEAPAGTVAGGGAGPGEAVSPEAALPAPAVAIPAPPPAIPGLEVTKPLHIPGTLFDVTVFIPQKYRSVLPGEELIAEVRLLNIARLGLVPVQLEYNIWDVEQNVLYQEYETKVVENEITFLKEAVLPADIPPGDYLFVAILRYDGGEAIAGYPFMVLSEKSQIGTLWGALLRSSIFWLSALVLLLVFVGMLWLLRRKYRRQ
ncbi:hypothetical protein HYS49_02615 [Candidatus Woesearchaeota archaeon]|nr:hypothetical protein [Candidatus Woesearchaeota archaeon]